MKTLNFAMLIIVVCFITFITSCSKDSLIQDSKEQKLNIRTDDPPFFYYDHGGNDYGCDLPPTNCFEAIVVTGNKLDEVNDIFSHISTWTAGQVSDFFDDNSADMSSVIGSDETAGLISGSYNLRTRGTQLTSFRYLITRSGTTVISVTPIDN